MPKRTRHSLQRDLEELEASDPVVAEAAQRMYDPVLGPLAVIRRHERHLAARAAVGERR